MFVTLFVTTFNGFNVLIEILKCIRCKHIAKNFLYLIVLSNFTYVYVAHPLTLGLPLFSNFSNYVE